MEKDYLQEVRNAEDSNFGPLVAEALNDGRRWRLHAPLVYVSRTFESFIAPSGFVTDFASVPRGLWNLFPTWGRYGKAAVIHDYLYRTAIVPRSRADRLFLEAMEDLGVSGWRRYLMWAGVRAFGWLSYTGDAK